MSVLKYIVMKTFKLNSQILIICCALIASGTSTQQKHIGLDGREYLMEDDKKYNWYQAGDECARMNRQLLTIDSAEKQNVINELLKGFNYATDFWLGASNKFNGTGKADRSFFWSATGNQLTYTNWRNGKPYGVDDTQHCVLIASAIKKWLSWICIGEIGFICEEKQSLESSNKNPNNASVDMEKYIKDFELKFLILLKDNMAQLNGRLENIEKVGDNTIYEVNRLANITQTSVEKILNKQELSTKELHDEITKEGNDLSDQLKRSVDELNAKLSEKQNFTSPRNNIVLINPTGR